MPTACRDTGHGNGDYMTSTGPPWLNQSQCEYSHLTCGDIELGSNVGAPKELGNPRSGDVFYLLTIFGGPKAVAVTTCRINTVVRGVEEMGGVYSALTQGRTAPPSLLA